MHSCIFILLYFTRQFWYSELLNCVVSRREYAIVIGRCTQQIVVCQMPSMSRPFSFSHSLATLGMTRKKGIRMQFNKLNTNFRLIEHRKSLNFIIRSCVNIYETTAKMNACAKSVGWDDFVWCVRVLCRHNIPMHTPCTKHTQRKWHKYSCDKLLWQIEMLLVCV